jgi:hypothetical protein
MKAPCIELLIHPSGEIQIEAMGFHGADCEKATAFLAQALGKVTRTDRKPEYYRRVSAQERQAVGK